MIKIQAGKLLLAEPFMPDHHFKRSVVMICEHKEEGSVGFIINKELNIGISDAIEDIENFQSPLFYGGPVETNTIHYFHNIGDSLEGSVAVTNGLYWGGDFELLKTMIRTGLVDPADIRFFLGYSGWGTGQLDSEMKEKSWIIHDGRPEHIFKDGSDNLWRKILLEKGGDYKLMANYPEDPSLN